MITLKNKLLVTIITVLSASSLLPSLSANGGPTEGEWMLPAKNAMLPWDARRLMDQRFKGPYRSRSYRGYGGIGVNQNMGQSFSGWVPVWAIASTERNKTQVIIPTAGINLSWRNGGGQDDISAITFDRDGNFVVGQYWYTGMGRVHTSATGTRDWLKSKHPNIPTYLYSSRTRGGIYIVYAPEEYFYASPEVSITLE